MSGYPPKKNVTTNTPIPITLVDSSDRPKFKSSPTLAEGDFKISLDGSTLNNLATLPIVTPASGVIVEVILSQAEWNADRIAITAIDAAGDEWDDLLISIQTAEFQIGADLVDANWDESLTGSSHNISTSAGKRLRQIEEAFIHADGVIAVVTNGHTFTLDTGAVAEEDYYVGSRLQISEGTGAGQSRIIVAYTSGRVVTLDSDYITNPDTSSLYEIDSADVHVSISDSDLAEGFVAIYTDDTTITLDAGAVATEDYYKNEVIVFTHGTGKGQSRQIESYTSGRVVTMSPALVTALDTTTTWHIMTVVSPEHIAEDTWNTLLSAHTTAGSAGKAISDIETDTNNIQTILPGLMGENVKWSAMTFDSNNNMIAATITEYTDNTLVTPVKSWTVAATYNANSELLTYQLVDV